jgi:dTDP-4-dehydrorhamnose 3,5-epimerase
MKFTETGIEGVVIVDCVRHEDARGWFAETFSQREFGDRAVFVQDNEVWSRRGVVRGLHFQRGADAQAKLVRAARGRILDVAVDIRRGSPTFGHHVAVELSAENGLQMFVPRGFAHGYSVLSDEALVCYKCDNYYAPASEAGVRYDDPALGIDWGLPASEHVPSERDLALPLFKEAEL